MDVGKYVEIDVTPWAKEWVKNAALNQGVILRLINQTSFTYYRMPSREHWNAVTQDPRLVITYVKP